MDSIPRAVVEQIGRFTFHVYVIDGAMRWGPEGYGWHVWGRERAERKASKELLKYLIREERMSRWVPAFL